MQGYFIVSQLPLQALDVGEEVCRGLIHISPSPSDFQVLVPSNVAGVTGHLLRWELFQNLAHVPQLFKAVHILTDHQKKGFF